VVVPVRTDATGLTGPRRREAAGPDWRRSSHGRYVGASVPLTPCQRVVEAGCLLPRRGAVTGWGSLAWHVDGWFTGLRADGSARPVPLALPFSSIRDQPLMHVCTERWTPDEVEIIDGLPVHTAVRAVCYEMRYQPYVEAAAIALSMAAFHDLVSVDEAKAWIDLHPSYTGIEQARLAWPLGDENAWSPAEVSMKLVCVGAGHTELLSNRPLFDLHGHHVGTPDLIDPVTGVLGEYQGEEFHAGRRGLDLARMHDFRAHGLEPVEMVAADIRNPQAFLARLRAAYAAAEAKPASERQWTLELPPWWVPTFTVEQRRALSPRDRDIWLRHRAAGGRPRLAG
jgi:hypothetical protein